MKVLILAAGYGTRLKEFCEHLPKGLIPYKATTLMGHLVSDLYQNGIHEVTIITNAKYFDQYSQWAKTQTITVNLINDHTTTPDNRLGALGDLRYAISESKYEDQDILVLPSDNYFEFSLKTFISTINKSPNEFSVIVKELSPDVIKNRLGCAKISPENKLEEFVEKPETPLWPYGVMPFYYYPAKILPFLKKYQVEGNSLDAPGSFIPWLLRNHLPVNACIVTDNTIDIGTPDEVKKLKDLI